jgi:hypothetical protein
MKIENFKNVNFLIKIHKNEISERANNCKLYLLPVSNDK